ncbi:hypothetical protein E2C01_053943 [Portunus trituberculatus]|uniref:Uncharacterized protein n=1 Tax=Portunus trituberculatus TaxID=210409 RepID=A0A5B7GTM8_PORTR|nr:hypothetical protein [Portunus trituberculatus]
MGHDWLTDERNAGWAWVVRQPLHLLNYCCADRHKLSNERESGWRARGRKGGTEEEMIFPSFHM